MVSSLPSQNRGPQFLISPNPRRGLSLFASTTCGSEMEHAVEMRVYGVASKGTAWFLPFGYRLTKLLAGVTPFQVSPEALTLVTLVT